MRRWLTHPIAAFLVKLAAVCGVWFIFYDLWLLPDGRVDAVISENVAAVSAWLMERAGFTLSAEGRDVVLSGTRGVRIADGCNGLSPIGLFIGFILAYPGSWRHRAWFLPMGVVLVYLTNVARVMALAVAQLYWPAGFEMMHGFGMTTVFYVVIFGLWAGWVEVNGSVLRR